MIPHLSILFATSEKLLPTYRNTTSSPINDRTSFSYVHPLNIYKPMNKFQFQFNDNRFSLLCVVIMRAKQKHCNSIKIRYNKPYRIKRQENRWFRILSFSLDNIVSVHTYSYNSVYSVETKELVVYLRSVNLYSNLNQILLEFHHISLL